jgi:hypothetical protein
MVLTHEQAQKVFSLLIGVAQAHERDRNSFVRYVTSRDAEPVHEYRFQGCLGFGGKFVMLRDEIRVTTYGEDATAERRNVIDRLHVALAEMGFATGPLYGTHPESGGLSSAS